MWRGESTSDSERECGENEEKTRRRHRRRLNHRHDRKKESAVTDEEETKRMQSGTFRNGDSSNNNKKSNGKLGKATDNVTYNSEVKITNNYGGINIERNGEIIIGSDGYPIIQGSSPKSTASKAKMDAKIRQISEDKDNPDPEGLNEDEVKDEKHEDEVKDEEDVKDEDEALDKTAPISDNNNNNKAEMTQTKPEINIDDNIEEIKTLANTIEQTAKSITQEVIHIQQNLHEDMIKLKQVDQLSLVSNTSLEESEHKELVVEAAVHEPPKEAFTETAADENPQEEADPPEEISQDLEADPPQTSVVEESPDPIEVKEEIVEEAKQEEAAPPPPASDEVQAEVIEVEPVQDHREEQIMLEEERPEAIDEAKLESPKDQVETDSPKSIEDKTGEIEDEKAPPEEKPSSKEDASDISIETPDTIKLADRNLDDQKTLSDSEQKIESIEDENEAETTAVIEEEGSKAKEEEEDPVKPEETASSKEESSSPKEEATSPKDPTEVNAEGVTAVNVESKDGKEPKKKFLKEKKVAKKGAEATPKERSKRDRTPRPDDSTREAKASKKEKIKTEERRSKEKIMSDR